MTLYWVLHNGTYTPQKPFVCICDVQPTPFDFERDYNTPISKTMLTGSVEVEDIPDACRIPFDSVTTDRITFPQVAEMVAAYQQMGGTGVPTIESLSAMFGQDFTWVESEIIAPIIERYKQQFIVVEAPIMPGVV